MNPLQAADALAQAVSESIVVTAGRSFIYGKADTRISSALDAYERAKSEAKPVAADWMRAAAQELIESHLSKGGDEHRISRHEVDWVVSFFIRHAPAQDSRDGVAEIAAERSCRKQTLNRATMPRNWTLFDLLPWIALAMLVAGIILLLALLNKK